MALPEPEFETTVKTIAKFVDTILPSAIENQKSKAPLANQVRKEALQVFERAAEASKRPVTTPERIARVS
jgi:L-serine deaminase